MYPIMIDVHDLTIVIIGGGKIATRKVKGLLEAGAHPHVIAPDITETLQEYVDLKQVTWQPKCYQTGDLKGADLIFICTNQEDINQQIVQDAEAHQWVNDACDHDNSRFYNMGVIREDEYLVATSSYGQNPKLAKQLRNFLKNNLMKFD